MSTAAATSHAAAPAAGHSHHPNYIAIFIWLVILTVIEVSIPELVHINGKGHDRLTPSVLAPTAFQEDGVDEAVKQAAASMAPSERFQAAGWAMRIGVLSILAIIKTALVGAFFMHLRFDGWKLNFILAMPTALFVFIIIMLAPDIAVDWPQLY